MKATKFRILSLFLCLATFGSASAYNFLESTGPHELSIGPDVYYLQRDREGGTHQEGWLGGLRLNYERLKSNGFYATAELRYATGVQDGKSSSGATLKSTLQEFQVEGDLGWTLGFCLGKPVIITPYIGYGYFWSSNAFRNPSPMQATFCDTYEYTAVGVFTAIEFSPCFTIGVNFKARWMADAEQKISDGPAGEDVRLKIGDGWLYNVDIPISYHFNAFCRCWRGSLIPYWEQRDYGGTASIDGDFIDTRYVIYGLRLMVGTSF